MKYEEFWNKFIEIFYAKRAEIKFLLQYLELARDIQNAWQNVPELNIAAIEATEIKSINLLMVEPFTVKDAQFSVTADLGNYYNPMISFYFDAYEKLAKEPSASNLAVKTAVEQKLQSIKEILEAIKPQLIDVYAKASGEDLSGWERVEMYSKFAKGGRVINYGDGNGGIEPSKQMLYEALNLKRSYEIFMEHEAERLAALGLGK